MGRCGAALGCLLRHRLLCFHILRLRLRLRLLILGDGTHAGAHATSDLVTQAQRRAHARLLARGWLLARFELLAGPMAWRPRRVQRWAFLPLLQACKLRRLRSHRLARRRYHFGLSL